jgi:hypothetical protein
MFKPQLLSGTVTELKILEGKHNFVMSGGMQAAAGTTAIGAALAGSFFSGALLARSAMATEDAISFTCRVDGVKLSGCFSRLGLNEGEVAEFVVDYSHNQTEAVVYAVRKPQNRQLWIVPMMESGHGVIKRMAIFFPIKILKYLLPLIFIFILLMASFLEGISFLMEVLPFIFSAVCIAGVLMYLVMVLGMFVSYIPKAKLATQVIGALGYDDPANTNLVDNSLNIEEQWEKEHSKPFPKTDELSGLHY